MIFRTSEPHSLALDDLTRRRTWAELDDRCTRMARWLREEAGLRVGEHCACIMQNRAECVELTIAAMLAGIWLTPINWHLHAEEIAYVTRDSGARVVFTDAEHEPTAREVGAESIVRAGEELDRLLAAASDEPMPLDGPAGGTMLYTSGTTGYPKGVKRAVQSTLAAQLDAARAAGRAIGLDGSGPHLVTGPLYHAAPLWFAVYDQLNGAPVIVMPRWREAEFIELAGGRGVHHTHLVPTMFVRLLRLPRAERARFRAPALHHVLHGAAPIAPHVKREMIEWWGPILVEYWGATESGVCTLVDSRDWLAHPGTVGRALPGIEVFAADEEGRRLPPGEIGVLYCRHRLERVFEYHQAPEKTAGSYLGPGVFTIGDIGSVDAEGYVFLADRKSHMIISGGANIYPAEIEKVLQRHAAVADVCVFGIPDEEWGESVKAAIELVAGQRPTPELAADILAFAREHLARYKVPRSIDFEEKLPRHPSGKVYTRLLRDRYRRS